MIRINKRAQVKPMQEIITALLVLGFAIFIMAIFSSTFKNSQLHEGEEFIGSAIAENTFALYLKQPVKHEGLDLTMADLIVLAAENKGKYGGVWEKETERFFSIHKIDADEVEIKVPEKGLKINVKPPSYDWVRESSREEVHLEAYLPSYSGLIKVEGKMIMIRYERLYNK